MTTYLWSKDTDDGVAPTDLSQVQAYLSGNDVILDRQLMSYDIQATEVHARGLQRIGVLTAEECSAICQSLAELSERWTNQAIELGPPFEDSHSMIEHWLTEKLGETGQKVHTGRSRNDQVQVAMRLYLKDRVAAIRDVCQALALACLERAEQDAMTPLPGYTHLQRAVPSSIGLWMGAFTESFLDMGELAIQTLHWIDACPLGTAAGYGVNLPLDRDFVAKELGFARVQQNPMYVQNSRGCYELQALQCLAQATLALRRLAWDLSLYTSQEFAFVRLAKRFVTGSSIMPNKSNPDFVELIRAQHAVVQGALSELQSLLSLPSGYHRDLQLTKPPVLRAFETSLMALQLSVEMIQSLEFNKEAMAQAIDPELYATDFVLQRVTEQGMSFRQAYRQPVERASLEKRKPEESLRQRVSPGSCGHLMLEALRQRWDAARASSHESDD